MFQLVKKACDFLLDKFNTLTAFAFVGVCTLTSYAFGQSGATVTFTPPDVDLDAAATELVTSLTTVAIAGIGVAISIWALLMVTRVFKRSAS